MFQFLKFQIKSVIMYFKSNWNCTCRRHCQALPDVESVGSTLKFKNMTQGKTEKLN